MSDGNGEKSIEQLALDKSFQGLSIRLGQMVRQDGIMAEYLDKNNSRNLGVIQTIITAEVDDNNYRQILKRARWHDQEHRDKYVKALAVCRITGAVKAAQTLLDMITADSAGDNGIWAREAYEGLTHTTITTQESIERKKRHDDRAKNTSPIG